VDTGKGSQGALQLHEDNRVIIGSGAYLHLDHGLSCTVP
jgi:hypothetical protein